MGIRGRSIGPHGPSGGREEAGRVAPLAQTELDLGWGRGRPFLLLLHLFPLLPFSGKEGGILLGLGVLVRLPLWRAPSMLAAPSSPPLYTGAGGTSRDTTIDLNGFFDMMDDACSYAMMQVLDVVYDEYWR